MSETAARQPHNMDDLIRHAAGCAVDMPPQDVGARVADLAGRFNAACLGLPAAPLTLVTFHLKLPEEHRRIDYVDIKADQGRIDYVSVLRHTFAMARGFNPEARIVYITGEDDDIGFVPSDVVTVRLPLQAKWLMYERVVAMAAYMQSAAFDSNTVFLDSDAFCNWPLSDVFRLSFDVAVTFRDPSGMMPVNEGVIFAAHRPGLAARNFFSRYLGTYEALCNSRMVTDLYGDIRRWRGGQLALNGAAAAVGVLGENDQRHLAGALVRYLPCDDYNFFIRDNETYQVGALQRKYILHLKGPSKGSVATMSQFQTKWLGSLRGSVLPAAAAPVAAPPADSASASLGSAGFVAPVFSLVNKEYGNPPFNVPETRNRFVGMVKSAGDILKANEPNSGAVSVDDMLLWFRNIGFLEEPDFVNAFRPFINDPVLRARIWRVYMLCWGARSCMRVPGDFIDVGCYDGRTVEIMERYCNFAAVKDKTWWLYDMFENPPTEARKASHGPKLFDTVRQTFEPRGNFRVIKGPVPDSFSQGLPERIAFAQIDLNAAEPEIATLNAIYDRIAPGGLIIFDDYGFRRHRPSYLAEFDYFAKRGEIVWESPTGQGLFIKR